MGGSNGSAPRVRINTVEIPVADLARAVEWYERCLGFVAEWSDEHHAMLVAREGDESARILLVETDDHTRLAFRSTKTSVTHSVVDFVSDDLDALHAHLRSCGANADDLGPPANDWAPRGFGFVDPDRNRLGAFSYGV